MTRASLITMLSLAASIATAPAFATSGFTPANNEAGGRSHPMPSSRTREEVKQEARDAVRNGTAQSGEVTDAPEFERAASQRSRAEVAHEAEQFRNDETLRELNRN